MSTKPIALVNEKEIQFGQIWVHLKSELPHEAQPIKIEIPSSDIHAIFDDTNMKGEHETWPQFIQGKVTALGTFILEGYLDEMRKVAHEGLARKKWVLIRLGNIEETDDGLTLHGFVEQFRT